MAFGNIDRIPESVRDVVAIVAGGRGGKTYILVAIRVLHLALTVSLDTLAPGEVASAPIIAPDKDLAGQALRYIQGAVASKPELRGLVIGKPDAAESIELQREHGRSVEIAVKAASAKGRTGRGRSLVCAVMDEAAFFYDSQYHVNDEEIFRGLQPRVLPGGQTIIDSTPWSQVGLLYELFAKNHPNPECAGLPARPVNEGTALAVHAPTLVLRNAPLTRTIVEREQKRDPENAQREFGAMFMSAGTTAFFEPACIEKCLDLSLPESLEPETGVEVCAGGDIGLTKNSSALCVGHKRGAITTVAEMIEDKPKDGEALRPSAIAKKYVEVVAKHGGSYLMADGHYRESLVEHASPVGLDVIAAPSSPAEAFVAVRARMREGLYRFPNNPRFLRQLRETVGRKGSGGQMTIVLPKWKTGEHGDLVAAFVLMAYQAAGVTVPDAEPEPGTVAWFAKREAEMLAADLARETRERREADSTFSGMDHNYRDYFS